MWPPSCWSVYMLPIRTNNDIEGWHNSLNQRANNRVHLPFYLLVELLHQEARLVSIQIQLVSDGKLSRIQRRKYRFLQSQIFKYWENYNNSEITARRLLKLCSDINGPTRCCKPNLQTAPLGATTVPCRGPPNVHQEFSVVSSCILFLTKFSKKLIQHRVWKQTLLGKHDVGWSFLIA